MHINKWVSKRESEHTRGEWAHEREGGNSNSNRASTITSGANNSSNNSITSSNGSGSKNSNGGDSRNGNGGDSGKGEQEGGPVHMNQEVRAGKCKLGAGETDSKHSQTGRTTRGEAGVHEPGASEEEVWCT